MSDTQKGYRSWPSNLPTYHPTSSEEVRSVTYNKNWNYSLCDCCSPGSLCLTSCCIPGLTFGKMQARLRNPTLENYSSCNGECAIFTLRTFTWTQWLLQTIQRGKLRQKYGIR
ncbi:hypothetical protein BO94DRAFT_603756 [Aspergillus sclerotioniger CBS 115572]|uniref:PLAC8-domain-containing protein n=1 Tax=Aspergillus sclerotioniger CBS 115572 TaxID=1450535 RepID=A0A317VW81_9EURO|nr:hypothetical protein BO94DRAFT_603756 [Aspergillus sclerotioniger CBS 115572]PWY78025.1 hypothetical protein BO94DRAFT_603756 [Aspergillus sclerotioniger CBS 115572]